MRARLLFRQCAGALILCTLYLTGIPPVPAQDRLAIEKDFATFLKTIRDDALAQGISEKTVSSAFSGVKLDWSLPDLSIPGRDSRKSATKKKRRQPEFDRPGRYFPEKRLTSLTATGKRKWSELTKTMDEIEKRVGVEAEIILAIWGRETAFGSYRMRHDVFQALATQAFMGNRKAYFHPQLMLALKILDEGHAERSQMRSSWAGAMGYTQFLPSDFKDYAIDFDGDGRANIWSSVPDALASAANALKVNGWQPGVTWGYEVRRPAGFDCTLEGPANQRLLSEWKDLELVRSFGRNFPDERLNMKASLLTPTGHKGPAFLVLDNFFVLKTYNFSNLYALYVGNLADRIQGGGPFEAKWPTVAAFSREEVRQLQRRLTEMDFTVGKIDGIIGPLTRVAIGKYQRRNKLDVTCFPTRKLFEAILKPEG